LIFFATGQGLTQPPIDTGAAAPASPFSLPGAEVAMSIGGRSARVDFSALTPGTAGVMQIHAQVPSGMAPGGALVLLRVGGRESQSGFSIAVN
jgi:uncharacterized protein (TIGR03437 family)